MIELGIGFGGVELRFRIDNAFKEIVMRLYVLLHLWIVTCPPLVAKGINKDAQLNLSK